MSLSIIPLNQIFGKYDQQTRMGELNRKNPIKTISAGQARKPIYKSSLKSFETLQVLRRYAAKRKFLPARRPLANILNLQVHLIQN